MINMLKFAGISFIIGLYLLFIITILILKDERDNALSKLEILTTKINIQNNSIMQLHESQIKREKEINNAIKNSKRNQYIYSKQISKLLDEKVSTDCNQAIKWGIDKGSIISACWSIQC